ncbi:MAG: radical SAM protein [Nitrosomonadales bacterium]|jgi:wyosine [tRNA(Phe)-imidazoG37] synthetase (radical SAM superfamily)
MSENFIDLHTENHDRDIFPSKYIYPVISRRAGGLSLGINLNTNNACNWQCIYCEVPNLIRGKPEAINCVQLQEELHHWLNEIINRSFLSRLKSNTEFKDIAFSGNGEPSACPELFKILTIVVNELELFKLQDKIKIRIISNGSLLENQKDALQLLQSINGEIWFKVDATQEADIKMINQINPSLNSIKNNLAYSIQHCKTIIQSCFIEMNQQKPDKNFLDAYAQFLKPYQNQLAAIHIYSLARASRQNPAIQISRLSHNELIDVQEYLKQKLDIPIEIFA